MHFPPWGKRRSYRCALTPREALPRLLRRARAHAPDHRHGHARGRVRATAPAGRLESPRRRPHDESLGNMATTTFESTGELLERAHEVSSLSDALAAIGSDGRGRLALVRGE